MTLDGRFFSIEGRRWKGFVKQGGFWEMGFAEG